ncbi:transient receptor potential cation channel subfamily M member 1-like [Saccoglossus kowalevskii]
MEPQIYVIFKSLYKPYWQLYGELFLEEVECLIDNETCHTDPRYLDTCPDVPDNIRWVAPTLTAIYMLISNILLINLLIAMFSYTFQKVQDNSETIWRFYRYELISEYHDRPTLAPPLIIINHGYRMARYLYHQINLKVELNEIENMHNKKKEEKDKKKTEIKNKFDRDQSHTLRVCLDERLEDYLNSFERKCMGNYFIKINQEYVQSWESTVSSTGERLVKVMHEVEEMKESFYDSKNVQQDGRGDRKDVQQDGRGDRKDVQQDGRSDRKDVQQDGRGDSKDVQQDGRGESKDVQQDRRGDSKDPQMSFVSHQMGQMNDRIGGLELKMGKIETDMKKMLQILEGNSQALLP